MGKTVPTVTIKSWRYRDDSQTLNSSTFTYAVDTNVTIDVDTRFRLRAEIEETAGAGTSNNVFRLEYQLNGAGGYSAVPNAPDATAPIFYGGSKQYSNADATTNVLTASSASFTAGDGTDGYPTTSSDMSGSDHTEWEWALILPSGNVTDGDYVDLRIVGTDGNIVYTSRNVGQVTVNKENLDSIQTMAVSSTASYTATLPTGWADGDEALLFLGSSVTTQTHSTPSGWTLLQGPNDGNGSDERGYMYRRTLQSGDSGPSISWSGSNAHYYVILVYPNVGTFDSSQVATPTAGTSQQISSVSVTNNDSFVGLYIGRDPTSQDAYPTVPTGFTEAFWITPSSAYFYAHAIKTAETSGTKSYTWTVSESDENVLYAAVYSPAATFVTLTAATYTYSAQAISSKKKETLTPATYTYSGVAPTAKKKKGVTQSSYTYSAVAVTSSKRQRVTLVQATYTYSGVAPSNVKRKTLAWPLLHVYQPVAPTAKKKETLPTPPTYTYSGQALSLKRKYVLTNALYVYMAQAVAPTKHLTPTAATYTYSAVAVTRKVNETRKDLVAATYTYSAQAVTAKKLETVAIGNYTYSAVAVAPTKHLDAVASTYTYSAQAVTAKKLETPAAATYTYSGLAPSVRKQETVTSSVYTYVPAAPSVRKQQALVTASYTYSAQPVTTTYRWTNTPGQYTYAGVALSYGQEIAPDYENHPTSRRGNIRRRDSQDTRL